MFAEVHLGQVFFDAAAQTGQFSCQSLDGDTDIPGDGHVREGRRPRDEQVLERQGGDLREERYRRYIRVASIGSGDHPQGQ